MKDVELESATGVSSTRKKITGKQPSSTESSGSKAGVGGKFKKWFWSLVKRKKPPTEGALKESDSRQSEDGGVSSDSLVQSSSVRVYQEEVEDGAVEEVGLLNAIRTLETEVKRRSSADRTVVGSRDEEEDPGRDDVTSEGASGLSSQHTMKTIFRNDYYRQEDEEEVEGAEEGGVGRLRVFESAVRVIEGSKRRIYDAIGGPPAEDSPLIESPPPPPSTPQQQLDAEKSGAEETEPSKVEVAVKQMKFLFSPDPPSLTQFLFAGKKAPKDDWDEGHEGDDEDEGHDEGHDRHEEEGHEEGHEGTTTSYLLLIPSTPSIDLHLTDSLVDVHQSESDTTRVDVLDEILMEEVILLGRYD